MSTDGAELSSIQGSLEDLAARIDGIATRRDNDPDDPLSESLFEVERSLRNAARRLERIRGRV